MRVLSTIARVSPADRANYWRLELSCGHVVYERNKRRPSIWYVEGLGRRRTKRCAACAHARQKEA